MIHGDYYYDVDNNQEEWAEIEIREPSFGKGKITVEISLIFLVALVMFFLGRMALDLDIKIIEPRVALPPIVPLEGLPATQPLVERQSDVDLVESEANLHEPMAVPLPDASNIVSPYENYVITQGAHGSSYGHMAIDIAGGKGAPIRSPISGIVSEQFVDAIGNTTIVIENERYRVTLLHGIYTPNPGDYLVVGQVIGSESNQGNTRDMQGNSCRGRDCGYHTHLNIFDVAAGANVNPLDFISS